MEKRNRSFERHPSFQPDQGDGEQEMNVVRFTLLGIFVLLEFLFLVTVPFLALFMAIIVFLFAVPFLKQVGLIKKREKSPSAGAEKQVNWKAGGQKAAKKYVSRVTEESVREKEYKSHPHTPVDYSYDSCAKEKRLEQIRTLKNAGLLTEEEYKERRSSILAEK